MSAPLRKAEGRFSETAFEDEVVVMQLDSGEFFSLTGTARDIWLLIDGRRSAAEIVATLAAVFACTESEIAGDVADFLAQMTEAQLVVAE